MQDASIDKSECTLQLDYPITAIEQLILVGPQVGDPERATALPAAKVTEVLDAATSEQ
ncbi:MAG: hypothetical protein KJN97_11445 [Deltaproteobacteria bacterium]|nr:hypothetical protein [Deltaproteobacteria bacterium]